MKNIIEKNGDYIFWQEQFKDCKSLTSADIIFELPATIIDGAINSITNLFAGCSNLSYIKVKEYQPSFVGGVTSNDWLVAGDLPNNGTLILPAVYNNSDLTIITKNELPTLDKYFMDFSILNETCITTLIIDKGWTLKFE